MAQVGNNENRFGGRYMVQDSNHMSEISGAARGTQRTARQVEQSDGRSHQQGGERHTGGQQGGERAQEPLIA